MHIRLFSVSLGVAALAACAAPAPADTQVATQETGSCQVQYRTGTNIPVKTCTTEEEARIQKQQTDMTIQSMRSNQTKGGN
jgi:hypothetical protein